MAMAAKPAVWRHSTKVFGSLSFQRKILFLTTTQWQARETFTDLQRCNMHQLITHTDIRHAQVQGSSTSDKAQRQSQIITGYFHSAGVRRQV